jgi:hypothetical protein
MKTGLPPTIREFPRVVDNHSRLTGHRPWKAGSCPMPLSCDVVTKPLRNSAEVSSLLTRGVRVVAEFRRIKQIDRIRRFHLNRRSHAANIVSIFVFAIIYFLADVRSGLQDFCRDFAKDLRRIAPVAGLSKLASAGALSGALSAVDRGTSEAVADELLQNSPGAMDLLGQPAVLYCDSQGERWHVIDFDPTVTAFRLRDLPAGEDLAPPVRRSPGVPGYTGQKRGETRIRHLPLLHSGAGLWMAHRLEEPGAPLVRSFKNVLASARPWWPRLGGPQKVIIRFDGEVGHTGGFRVCKEEGLHAVGRLSRYSLLERPEIQEALETAKWTPVPSSDAAKPTEAADLGLVTLYPAKGAVDEEEGPVEIRVVVSRLRPTDGILKHGVMIGGYQVEMYGTTLEQGAWPAEEVVALYRGRAVIENRFAQEDREFETERTFSFHLWGQALMVSFAMAIWNYLICYEAPSKLPVPSPEPRPPRPLEEPPALLFARAKEFEPDLKTGTEAPTLPKAVSTTEPCAELLTTEEASSKPSSDAEVSSITPANPSPAMLPAPAAAEPEARPGAPASVKASLPESNAILAKAVETYFADVTTTAGWVLDSSKGTISCPYKTTFRLTYTDKIRKKTGGGDYHRLILANSSGACNGCPQRITCFRSTNAHVAKRISRSVPPSDASAVAEILATLHPPVSAGPASREIMRTPQRPQEESIFKRPEVVEPGPSRVITPSFLPAEARKRARAALKGRVTIRFRRARALDKPHPLVEQDRRVRQHQRRPRNRPTRELHVSLLIISDRRCSQANFHCD